MKNKKLVELGILSEDENSGVSAISLVENPAIEVDFLYFKSEKFVKPSAGESEDEFIGRCIPVLRDEGKPEDQAIAICYSYWENRMEKFESYNDYPESAKAAAKRALEWRDSHPDQKCGTPVGWARANQLAKGENISEETIARMASFARHKQNSDTPYSEGCGGLMWDAWGGTAGIEWASNKLDEIRDDFGSIWIDHFAITPNPCWKGYEPIGLKEKGGRMVPNCVKMEGYNFKELDIFGYKTRFFFVCPGAQATFTHLISMNPDDETIGMIRAAAVIADRVFEIEKEVVDEGVATPEQLQEAVILVNDFYDIIYEIDEELGMVHNVQYMEGHLELILSYIPDEMSIDTAGLPPYVDEIGKKKDEYADIVLKTVLDAAAKIGWANEEFADAQAAPFAGSSLEELRQNLQMQPEAAGFTVYKYEGPPGQRDFCRQMIDLNRWYTYSDIETMEGIAVNAGFGLGGESTYSIWKYKGGPNCKHKWQKYYVTPDKRENKGPAPGIAGETPFRMPNRGYAMTALRFADEEQKIVVGPAMIPDMEIPRRDEDGDIYYVKFSEETIKEIMMKFMKEARTNATNQDHNEDNAAGAYVYESWLVEDPENDKANTKYGFNVPSGTWMVSMKVDDKETWKRVKNGELRGFSVEGFFSDLDEIQGLKKYIKIMKILKD
jgi:hypothetical protein